MADLRIFASRLKEFRINLGLSQRQMAEKIGITAATLSAYETNSKNPSISVAIEIANKFDVSLDWLCGIKKDNDIKEDFKKNYTYSDVIKLLIEISKIKGTYLDFTVFSLDIDKFEKNSSWVIYFKNYKLQNFIEEWNKMKGLYDNKIIDIDVYNLWIEKSLIKYNYSIVDEIDDELF